MKITVECTTEIIEYDGKPTRVWQGKTESGIPILAFISRIAVEATSDCSQFDRELKEVSPPNEFLKKAISLRMF